MERRTVVGIGLDIGPHQAFVERITILAREWRSSYVCIANAHMTVEAHRNPEFAEVLAGADLVIPDGMSLVYTLRYLCGIRQERVAGFDLMLVLLKTAEANGLTVFFYGETESVLDKIVERLRREYPRLRLAGRFSPPFRSLTGAEEAQAINAIKSSGAHLVLVALGCPKQEYWMARQKSDVQAVMIGFGAALSLFAGVRQRAPEWMRRYCLEWLYRLGQEPSRLWRRYLVTNTLFLAYVGRELFARMVSRRTLTRD